MKKIMTLLAAALVLAGSFVVTGCDLESEDGVPGKGAWIHKTISKKLENDNTNTLDVYLYYSDSEYTANDLRTGSNAVTVPAGLTVLFTASTDSDSAGSDIYKQLAGDKFVIKTYEKNAAFDDDASDETDLQSLKGLAVNDTSWRILYAAMLVSGTGAEKMSGTPNLIKAGKSYTKLDYETIKENLTWKQLLIMLLEA